MPGSVKARPSIDVVLDGAVASGKETTRDFQQQNRIISMNDSLGRETRRRTRVEGVECNAKLAQAGDKFGFHLTVNRVVDSLIN